MMFALSVTIDALCNANYLAWLLGPPGVAVGQGMDLVIGPIASILLYGLYDTFVGSAGILFTEIIPFLDFIPMGVIAWSCKFNPGGRYYSVS